MHSFCHFCITQNVNINRRWGSSSSGRREFLHKMRSKLQTSIFRSIFTLDECVCVCYVDCRYWDPVEWIPSNLRRCKHMILLVSVRWNRLLSFFNCTFSFISPSLLSIFFVLSLKNDNGKFPLEIILSCWKRERTQEYFMVFCESIERFSADVLVQDIMKL